MLSSGVWCHVDLLWTSILEVHIAFIFTVEKFASEEPATDTMEVIRSSEMSVHTRSTWIHIPEDGIVHSHRCENLKPYMDCSIHHLQYRNETLKVWLFMMLACNKNSSANNCNTPMNVRLKVAKQPTLPAVFYVVFCHISFYEFFSFHWPSKYF
jgi:hypothetical protein